MCLNLYKWHHLYRFLFCQLLWDFTVSTHLTTYGALHGAPCSTVHNYMGGWCSSTLPGTRSLADAYVDCVQARCYKRRCYEHLCIHLLVHRGMHFYSLCVGKELLICKIKSNCLPKRYGFYQHCMRVLVVPCGQQHCHCPILNIFALLVGVKMHDCEVWGLLFPFKQS